jgi:hypothetical protein
MIELLRGILNRLLIPAITSLLAFFVGKGWLTDSDSQQIATAAVLFIVSVVIGLVQTALNKRKVDVALKLPAGSPTEKVEKDIASRRDIFSVLTKIFL